MKKIACHHEERSDVVISFLDWQLAMQEIATGQKPLAMTLDFRICLEFGYWSLEFKHIRILNLLELERLTASRGLVFICIYGAMANVL